MLTFIIPIALFSESSILNFNGIKYTQYYLNFVARNSGRCPKLAGRFQIERATIINDDEAISESNDAGCLVVGAFYEMHTHNCASSNVLEIEQQSCAQLQVRFLKGEYEVGVREFSNLSFSSNWVQLREKQLEQSNVIIGRGFQNHLYKHEDGSLEITSRTTGFGLAFGLIPFYSNSKDYKVRIPQAK